MQENLKNKYDLSNSEFKSGIDILGKVLGKIADTNVLMAMADLLATGDIAPEKAKGFDISNDHELNITIDMINGNLVRMALTHDSKELESSIWYARQRIRAIQEYKEKILIKEQEQ